MLGAYIPLDEKTTNDQSTCILRTALSKGRLYFIITTGKPFQPETLSSVKRSFDDFKFLAKWLGYENPYSWVPPLYIPNGPKILHGKTVYQLFHEVQNRLNCFLRTLMKHPTFGTHELFWEFILVQDISRDSVIERCRRKLQNQQESQMEKESSMASDLGPHHSTSVLFYRSSELEPLHYFMQYAREQLTKLATSANEMGQGMQKISISVESYNSSLQTLFELIEKFPATTTWLSPITNNNGEPSSVLSEKKTEDENKTTNNHEDISSGSDVYVLRNPGDGWGNSAKFLDGHLKKSLLLGMSMPAQLYFDFSVSLKSLFKIVDSATTTLETPISMIDQLKEREATLTTLHKTLERTTGKNTWPMGMFEEKRVKDINDTNDKIYICQNEINRLSTDIHRYHETLASEIGALYTIHESEMKKYIETFTSNIIKSHKVSMERLTRIQSQFQLLKPSKSNFQQSKEQKRNQELNKFESPKMTESKGKKFELFQHSNHQVSNDLEEQYSDEENKIENSKHSDSKSSLLDSQPESNDGSKINENNDESFTTTKIIKNIPDSIDDNNNDDENTK